MELTDKTFDKEVYNSDIPVMVEFWGSWCPPCKMMAPIIDQLETEFAGSVKVCKLNIDRNRTTSGRFRIKGVPAMFFFENGSVVREEIGAKSYAQLRSIIEEHLDE